MSDSRNLSDKIYYIWVTDSTRFTLQLKTIEFFFNFIFLKKRKFRAVFDMVVDILESFFVFLSIWIGQ